MARKKKQELHPAASFSTSSVFPLVAIAGPMPNLLPFLRALQTNPTCCPVHPNRTAGTLTLGMAAQKAGVFLLYDNVVGPDYDSYYAFAPSTPFLRLVICLAALGSTRSDSCLQSVTLTRLPTPDLPPPRSSSSLLVFARASSRSPCYTRYHRLLVLPSTFLPAIQYA